MLSIYKASAGSGKTFTLAYEYIKLLLGYKDETDGTYHLHKHGRDRHRFILAVTFTNKATDEMKRRIIHELAVLGDMEPQWTEPSPYLDRLTHEFRCSPQDLSRAAATALRQLLFDFNFFQVSTIDSFFQIILRTFAREAELTGNYEVDLDNERAIGFGVRELFDSLRTNTDSTDTRRAVQWITDYLLRRLSEGKAVSLFNRSSHIHSEFLRFIAGISNDMFTIHYQEMMDYLSKPERLIEFSRQLSTRIDTVTAHTRTSCTEALRTIDSRAYIDGKKRKVSSYLLAQLSDVATTGEDKSTRTTAASVLQDITKAYTKPLKEYLDSSPDSGLEDSITEACRAIVESKDELKLLRNTRKNLFVLGILEKVYQYIDSYRADNNTILLSDTNGLLRDIIGDDDTPFIYERVGVWLHHFLIDEFQDTSRLQWENLRPLLHEGQASDHDSLIIGDEKQCIYRFRFSDPTLLQSQVHSDFPANAQTKGNDSAGNTNWRSSADVVRFNNALFSHLAHATGFTDIYGNVCQNVSPKHATHRGYVELCGIDTPGDALFEKAAMDNMLAAIRRQLASGYRPCDIAILTRFNKEASRIIEYLMREISQDTSLRNLRIISDDAMLLASSPAVRLIISVLRHISTLDTARDETPDAPHRSKRMRELSGMLNRYEYAMSRCNDPEAALKSALSHTDEALDIADSIGDMDCFNLPSIVERIIGRYISSDTAATQNMYISAFQDVIADFCTYGPCDVQSFLKWWDETGRRSKISAPFDERAIRVMSIHKSKGLEFKCVHIPMVRWNMVSFGGYEWFMTQGCIEGVDEEVIPPMLPYIPEKYMANTPFASQYGTRCGEMLLDELNVLYVAFTRAIDELIVCYDSTAKDSDSYPVSAMLAQTLPQLDGGDTLSEELPTDDGENITVTRTTFGTQTQACSEKSKSRTALDPETMIPMCGYYALDRDDLWQNTKVDSLRDFSHARERGIVLHDVLARVRHISHLPRAIKESVRAGELPEDESADVESYLQEQLMRRDVKPWFEGYRRVLCERPMTLHDGSVCRPDRVVWNADGGIDVIDYKFGAEHPKQYARQVRGYMEALEAMGHDNVRGYLWYVDSGMIHPV